MKRIITLITLLSLSFVFSIYADSPKIKNVQNGHWYQRIDGTMTWHEAKLYCENIGGHLATITSQDEHFFVYENLVVDASFEMCWLGATDEISEGTWRWITDEPWDFTNWARYEPNNCSSIEHYLTYFTPLDSLGRSGFWNDLGVYNTGGCGCGCPNEQYDVATICEWENIADNDFNKDSWNDILWRDSTTGQNGIWFMKNMERTDIKFINSLSNTDWKCIGTADMNGDSQTDIIWRHITTGENAVWYMNGIVWDGYDYFNTLSDTNWICGTIADFNSDGKNDILWRNNITGQNGIWFMDGVSRLSISFINTLSNPEWVCSGGGDFNGDGKIDILWRNSVTGENMVWYMNNTTQIGYDFLPILTDTNWICGTVADFNNDGKVDILWRNTITGENGIWTMNGIIRTNITFINSLSNTDWEVVN